jgi:hypothetical protein
MLSRALDGPESAPVALAIESIPHFHAVRPNQQLSPIKHKTSSRPASATSEQSDVTQSQNSTGDLTDSDATRSAHREPAVHGNVFSRKGSASGNSVMDTASLSTGASKRDVQIGSVKEGSSTLERGQSSKLLTSSSLSGKAVTLAPVNHKAAVRS